MTKLFLSFPWRETLYIVFCLITLIQLSYYGWFFRRLAFFTPHSRDSSQQHPVSVIICARDEAAKLVTHLPGSLVQTYPSTHEVIVVNHNSQDDTRFLLDEFKKTFKGLHIVNLEQEAIGIPGKKYPLSMGIKEAIYEIVLLTDADCMPASEFWMQKMQDGYSNGIEVVLGYSPYTKKPGFLNKIIRFDTFHTAIQYLSYALAGLPYMGVGRNLSYKKELFFRDGRRRSIQYFNLVEHEYQSGLLRVYCHECTVTILGRRLQEMDDLLSEHKVYAFVEQHKSEFRAEANQEPFIDKITIGTANLSALGRNPS